MRLKNLVLGVFLCSCTTAFNANAQSLLDSVTIESLTADTVPYANSNKLLTSSATTPTELGYLSGVLGPIQDQLGDRLLLDGTSLMSGPLQLPEISTPATPSSGYGKVYFKTDGKLYQLNDAGTEAQVGSDSGDGIPNYVKNPSGASDSLDITTNNATISRDTDIGDAIDGTASLICDASAQNGYCEFDLNTIVQPDDVGNCAFTGFFKGDATLYKAEILDGASSLLNSSNVLTNEANYKQFVVTHPCGTSRKVRFTQTQAGTGAAVNLGRVFWGRQEAPISIGSVTSFSTSPERIERAYIINTAGTPSVSTQSGSWISSVTDNGTGDYTLNFASGMFSQAPSCACKCVHSTLCVCQSVSATSTSSTRINLGNTTVALDVSAEIICMGLR